jgi:hypothetical protein
LAGLPVFRVAELTSGRRAAVITGAFHAIFHLPLLLIATTYQSEGKRWIVVPTVMITLTLAGVWYGWLRLWSGSIWPVSLAHSAFNNLMAAAAGLAIATSPAKMAVGPRTSAKPSHKARYRSPTAYPPLSQLQHGEYALTLIELFASWAARPFRDRRDQASRTPSSC